MYGCLSISCLQTTENKEIPNTQEVLCISNLQTLNRDFAVQKLQTVQTVFSG